MAGPNIRKKYEVHKRPGTYKKQIATKTEKGITYETVEADCGYDVYIARGASIHVPTDERLKELGFDKPAPLVDMETGDEMPNPGEISLRSLVDSKTKTRRPADHS